MVATTSDAALWNLRFKNCAPEKASKFFNAKSVRKMLIKLTPVFDLELKEKSSRLIKYRFRIDFQISTFVENVNNFSNQDKLPFQQILLRKMRTYQSDGMCNR